MSKLDLKKEWKHLYRPSPKKLSVVEVPPINFLMIDGKGDPNESSDYQEALDALYSVSYTAKFMVKKQDPALDYVVMPLEGLWWAADPEAFLLADKSDWSWTAMIAQPEHVSAGVIAEAAARAREKNSPAPAFDRLRFETYNEGLSVQIMHVGPYSAEAPTIEKLHEYMRQNDLHFRGKHHEIYLSDPRRAKPDNLKTIIRQPVSRS